MQRDELFRSLSYPQPFSFNHEVAEVFDDMISRSVPLYREVIELLCQWLNTFPGKAGATIYDVGCSTGTTLLALGKSSSRPLHFLGLDPSPAMLAKAQLKLQAMPPQHRLSLRELNGLSCDYAEAHLVVLNYTLQFMPVRERPLLLAKIFAGLGPGGLVVISEKVIAASLLLNEVFTRHYLEFKEQAGYSKQEISRKKEALEQVLIPLSVEEYRRMLLQVGFAEVEVVCSWHNFVTMVAIKG